MSRIESAKRRSAAVKRTLAGLAAASLVVGGLLARATNPGHAANPSTQGTPSTSGTINSGTQSSQTPSSQDFSVSPSLSQPKVETNVS